MGHEQKDIEVGGTTNILLTEQEKGKAPSEFNARANLVLLGAWAAMFCSVGFINAFGVFQEYYSISLLATKSESSISWIGSLQLFLMFGGTPAAGILTDKYGPRACLCAASVSLLIATFMMSLCTEYYQFILAQGILMGASMSFLLVPIMVTVAYYFDKSRGFALGITVSGSSIGGVIWPIALHRLFNELSFGWTVRICAFIMIPLLISACLFVRVPLETTDHHKLEIDPSCLKNFSLILLAWALFFIILALFTLFFYITPYTISLGLDANMAFYMVSITNGASLVGRLLPGLLADRYGAFNAMILSATISGIVCTCWTKATSIPGLIVLCVAYGFASGAVISLQGTCAAQLVKPQQYGIAMGAVMGFFSIAGLVGTPINGQLLNAGGYLAVSLFSGFSLLVGVIFLVWARFRINKQVFARA